MPDRLPFGTPQWLGRMEYAAALELQERVRGEIRSGKSPETLLLLEHEPVYTIGRIRDRSSLGPQSSLLPHPVHETNRGGQATFHGPGQLVGYPLLHLDRFDRDLHRYLRFLEDALIAIARTFGVAAHRTEGRTGIWTEDRKLASIGIGVRHWISMHGFALNVGTDLSGFDAIVPCGLAGVRMTSLALESGTPLTVERAAETAAEVFPALLPLKAVVG